MASRAVIAVVGASMVGIAAAGLVNPRFMLSFIGFSLGDPTSAAFQLGEVRAIYGGLFGVIGVSTLLSAIDPVANRGRLVTLGWCWLGIAGGRLLGARADGAPGLRGWALLTFELVAGGLVFACTLMARTNGRRAAPSDERLEGSTV